MVRLTNRLRRQMTRDRIFQAQRTGDASRRDLSHAVAHHGLRLDTPGAPQGCQSDLNRKKGRLDDIDFVQPRPRRIGGREFGEQRPIAVRSHRPVAAFDDLAKDRFLLQKLVVPCPTIGTLARETRRQVFSGDWKRLRPEDRPGRASPRKKASRPSVSCSGELPVTARR